MFDRLQKLFLSNTDDSTAESGLADETLLAAWTEQPLDHRTVQVFRPVTADSISGVILFLHGYAEVGLAENTVFTRCLQQHSLAAVCPSGGPCWWMDSICPDFHPQLTPHQWLKSSVLDFVRQSFPEIATPPALLGVSMGGQGVLQLAYQNARSFPVVAAIAPTVDFQQLHGSGTTLDQIFSDPEQARQATVVLNLHPLSWPPHQFFCCDPADHDWFDGAARLGMKLSSSGILHDRDLETSAGGHSWDYFNHMAPRAIEHCLRGLQRIAADQQ